MGNKVSNSGTSQKSYWKIINRVMNKCGVPKIPPLLVNNRFNLDCREKAKLFSQQCKTGGSVPKFTIFQHYTLWSQKDFLK